MSNPLVPQIDGQRLTVEAVMSRPTVIRDRVAVLAGPQILMPHLFKAYGSRVTGAGMLYSVIKASDFYTVDPVERRAPGSEYAVLRGSDPESKLAVVDDFGGAVKVTDEEVSRNDIDRIDSATVQITNSIVEDLDRRAIAAVEASDPETIAAGVPWDEQVMLGPLTDITPSNLRPTAAWAEGAALMELGGLGHVADTLLVHPNQKAALVAAYADALPGVLEAAGLKLVSNPRLTDGTAYLVQAGAVGTVGFEVPLTVEIVPERLKRSRWILGFCVPAFAVTHPGAVIKLTGLSS